MSHRSLEVEDFGGDCRSLAGTDASSGGGIRTPDTRIMIPLAKSHKGGTGQKLRHVTPADSLPLPYGASELPPDLAAIVDAWPTLPEPIRAGIVAMVKASGGATPSKRI